MTDSESGKKKTKCVLFMGINSIGLFPGHFFAWSQFFHSFHSVCSQHFYYCIFLSFAFFCSCRTHFCQLSSFLPCVFFSFFFQILSFFLTQRGIKQSKKRTSSTPIDKKSTLWHSLLEKTVFDAKSIARKSHE